VTLLKNPLTIITIQARRVHACHPLIATDRLLRTDRIRALNRPIIPSVILGPWSLHAFTTYLNTSWPSIPRPLAIASKVDGAWKGLSTQELITTADKIALGLMRLGIEAR
jgi:hypothetical protein